MLTGVEFGDDPSAVVTGAVGGGVVPVWDQCRALALGGGRDGLAAPLLIDLPNINRPQEAAKAGLRYVSIGRPEAATA